MIRRTPTLQVDMGLAGDALVQGLHQTRLTNARLATDHHHLPYALARPLPAFAEHGHFCLTPDERRQTPASRHLKAILGSTCLKHLIDLHRARNALERLRSQIAHGEITLHQSVCGPTDDHAAGRSESLQTRCYIGYGTQRQLFLTTPAAHLPNHHQTRTNGDSHR